jgi:hypothetical protein
MRMTPLNALRITSAYSALVRVLILATWILTACAPQVTPTFFVPPTAQALQPTVARPASSPTPAPTHIPSPIPTPLVPSATSCTNDLSFVQDVTVPDGTLVTPSERVDKQWLVTNAGTCNWDASYHLKLIAGDALDVPTQQVLYPARAGTQTTLRIVFTAPQTPGDYSSAWQAVAPDGTTFGQALTLHINVAP